MSDSLTGIFLKGLKSGGTPPQAITDFRWSLPSKNESGTWTPGTWTPKIEGRVIPCERGYHLIRAQDIPFWVRQFWELEVYVAEVRGIPVTHDIRFGDPKVAVREARLLRRVEAWSPATLRVWLCDVAEHVLPIYEDKNPGDDRVRACIDATRQYLRGEITPAQLVVARQDAANAAAHAALAANAAHAAAAAAAASAAAAHATDAAAAREEEQVWQSNKLLELLGVVL